MVKRILAFLISFCFIFEQTGFAQMAIPLGIPGYLSSLAPVADKFRPIHLRSIDLNSNNGNFELILDKGDLKDIKPRQLEETTQELYQYFQVGLTLPNKYFWVNLRPDSPDNVIEPLLEKTDVGRIMLAADLQLKKDLANFTSPQVPEGKLYWDRLYAKASELYSQQDIQIPTLTRPWIVPGEVVIRSNETGAFVYKATLKVMLEQDYLKDSPVYNFKDPRQKELNNYSSQLIRELILPKLTREVNSSRRYAQLRQVYYSLILAQWFKSKSQVKNIDNQDLTGLTSQTSWSKDTYYQAYRKSFQNGEYNNQEQVSSVSGLSIRRYFSGGEEFSNLLKNVSIIPASVKDLFFTNEQFFTRLTINPQTGDVANSPVRGVLTDDGTAKRDGGAMSIEEQKEMLLERLEALHTALGTEMPDYGAKSNEELYSTALALKRKLEDSVVDLMIENDLLPFLPKPQVLSIEELHFLREDLLNAHLQDAISNKISMIETGLTGRLLNSRMGLLARLGQALPRVLKIIPAVAFSCGLIAPAFFALPSSFSDVFQVKLGDLHEQIDYYPNEVLYDISPGDMNGYYLAELSLEEADLVPLSLTVYSNSSQNFTSVHGEWEVFADAFDSQDQLKQYLIKRSAQDLSWIEFKSDPLGLKLKSNTKYVILPKRPAIEGFRENILEKYGFTPSAAQYIRSHSDVIFESFLKNCSGYWNPVKQEVHLEGLSDEVAIHEFTHVWYEQKIMFTADSVEEYRKLRGENPQFRRDFVKAVVRLASADPEINPEYAQSIEEAHKYVFTPWREDVPAIEKASWSNINNWTNDDWDKVYDWEYYASLADFTGGEYKSGPRKLPQFMWRFYEPLFTGKVKATPYYLAEQEGSDLSDLLRERDYMISVLEQTRAGLNVSIAAYEKKFRHPYEQDLVLYQSRFEERHPGANPGNLARAVYYDSQDPDPLFLDRRNIELSDIIGRQFYLKDKQGIIEDLDRRVSEGPAIEKEVKNNAQKLTFSPIVELSPGILFFNSKRVYGLGRGPLLLFVTGDAMKEIGPNLEDFRKITLNSSADDVIEVVNTDRFNNPAELFTYISGKGKGRQIAFLGDQAKLFPELAGSENLTYEELGEVKASQKKINILAEEYNSKATQNDQHNATQDYERYRQVWDARFSLTVRINNMESESKVDPDIKASLIRQDDQLRQEQKQLAAKLGGIVPEAARFEELMYINDINGVTTRYTLAGHNPADLFPGVFAKSRIEGYLNNNFQANMGLLKLYKVVDKDSERFDVITDEDSAQHAAARDGGTGQRDGGVRDYVKSKSRAGEVVDIEIFDEFVGQKALKAFREGRAVAFDLSKILESGPSWYNDLATQFLFIADDLSVLGGNDKSIIYPIKEALKNGFFHGNAADFSLPLYINLELDNNEKVLGIRLVDFAKEKTTQKHNAQTIEIHDRTLLYGDKGAIEIIKKDWQYETRKLEEIDGFEVYISRNPVAIIASAESQGPDRNEEKILDEFEALRQIGSFGAAIKKGKYQHGLAVEIPRGVETILVGDLHARIDNLKKILNHNDNFRKLEEGKAALVILGDAVHGEKNLYEMASSVAMMQFIMELKIRMPDQVYYVLGNHDYLSDVTSKNGVLQGVLHKIELEKRYGKEYLDQYINDFLRTSPILAVGDGFAATHAGPILNSSFEEIELATVNRELSSAVQEATQARWQENYGPDHVEAFLESIGRANGVLVTGHTPQADIGWHWQDMQGKMNIIYAANEQVGYALARSGKLEFIDASDASAQMNLLDGGTKQRDYGILARLISRFNRKPIAEQKQEVAETTREEVQIERKEAMESAWGFLGRKDIEYTMAVEWPLFNINSIVPLLREGSVLDIGSGAGDLDLLLALEGHHTVGLDLSAEQVARAREKRKQMAELQAGVKIYDDKPLIGKSPAYFLKFAMVEPYRHFNRPGLDYQSSDHSYPPETIADASERLVFLPGDFEEKSVRKGLQESFGQFDNIVVASTQRYIHPFYLLESANRLLSTNGRLVMQISDIKAIDLDVIISKNGTGSCSSEWFPQDFKQAKNRPEVRYVSFFELAKATGFELVQESATAEDGAVYLVFEKQRNYADQPINDLYARGIPGDRYIEFFKQKNWLRIGVLFQKSLEPLDPVSAGKLKTYMEEKASKIDDILSKSDPLDKWMDAIEISFSLYSGGYYRDVLRQQIWDKQKALGLMDEGKGQRDGGNTGFTFSLSGYPGKRQYERDNAKAFKVFFTGQEAGIKEHINKRVFSLLENKFGATLQDKIKIDRVSVSFEKSGMIKAIFKISVHLAFSDTASPEDRKQLAAKSFPEALNVCLVALKPRLYAGQDVGDKGFLSEQYAKSFAEEMQKKLDFISKAQAASAAKTLVPQQYDNKVMSAGGINYYLQEWIDGPSIAEKKEKGPLTNKDVSDIAEAWMSVKKVLGVFVGDPHDENIMFRSDGTLAIIDLGLTRDFNDWFKPRQIVEQLVWEYNPFKLPEERVVFMSGLVQREEFADELNQALFSGIMKGLGHDEGIKFIREARNKFDGSVAARSLNASLDSFLGKNSGQQRDGGEMLGGKISYVPEEIKKYDRSKGDEILKTFFSFEDFMNEALFNPDWGYYSSGKVQIKQDLLDEGHFRTFPESMSPYFGELVGKQVFNLWKQMKATGRIKPQDKFQVLEFGAGNGTLAYDMLSFLTRQPEIYPQDADWKEFVSQLHYVIGEKSDYLRKEKQLPRLAVFRDKVEILPADALSPEEFTKSSFKGVIVSNELPDAFGVERVRFDQRFLKEGLFEVCVAVPTLSRDTLLRLGLAQDKIDVLERVSSQYSRSFALPDGTDVVYLSAEDYKELVSLLEHSRDKGLREQFELGLRFKEIFVDGVLVPQVQDYINKNKEVISHRLENNPRPFIIPVNSASADYIRSVAKILNAEDSVGYVLTIDYGGNSHEIIQESAADVSIRTFSDNESKGKDYYVYAGYKDLTADVDATYLHLTGEEAGLTTVVFGHQGMLFDYRDPIGYQLMKQRQPLKVKKFLGRSEFFMLLQASRNIPAGERYSYPYYVREWGKPRGAALDPQEMLFVRSDSADMKNQAFLDRLKEAGVNDPSAFVEQTLSTWAENNYELTRMLFSYYWDKPQLPGKIIRALDDFGFLQKGLEEPSGKVDGGEGQQIEKIIYGREYSVDAKIIQDIHLWDGRKYDSLEDSAYKEEIEKDALALFGLFCQIYPEKAKQKDEIMKNFRDLLQNRNSENPKELLWVYRPLNQGIKGYLTATFFPYDPVNAGQNTRVYLSEEAVDKEFQRQGVATDMLLAMMEFMEGRNVTEFKADAVNGISARLAEGVGWFAENALRYAFRPSPTVRGGTDADKLISSAGFRYASPQTQELASGAMDSKNSPGRPTLEHVAIQIKLLNMVKDKDLDGFRKITGVTEQQWEFVEKMYSRLSAAGLGELLRFLVEHHDDGKAKSSPDPVNHAESGFEIFSGSDYARITEHGFDRLSAELIAQLIRYHVHLGMINVLEMPLESLEPVIKFAKQYGQVEPMLICDLLFFHFCIDVGSVTDGLLGREFERITKQYDQLKPVFSGQQEFDSVVAAELEGFTHKYGLAPSVSFSIARLDYINDASPELYGDSYERGRKLMGLINEAFSGDEAKANYFLERFSKTDFWYPKAVLKGLRIENQIKLLASVLFYAEKNKSYSVNLFYLGSTNKELLNGKLDAFQLLGIEEMIKAIKPGLPLDTGVFIFETKGSNNTVVIREADGGSTTPGGLDFRELPVAGQPAAVPVLMPQLQQVVVNSKMKDLDQEWSQIRGEMLAPQMPYNRIKEYIAVCLSRPDCRKKLDQAVSCIIDILRMEEDQALATSQELKDILMYLS